MLKKRLFEAKRSLAAIALLAVFLAFASQVQAQTQQQQQEIQKLMDDLSAGKITYYEFLNLYNDVMNPQTPPNPQLITPEGKAWVMQDNQVPRTRGTDRKN